MYAITQRQGRPRNHRIYLIALDYILAEHRPLGLAKQIAYSNGLKPEQLYHVVGKIRRSARSA